MVWEKEMPHRKADPNGAAQQTARQPFHWPVNEVLLNDLICKGLSDPEIGAIYRVSWTEVRRLRETYDL